MNFWSCSAKTANISWQGGKQELSYMRAKVGKEEKEHIGQGSGLEKDVEMLYMGKCLLAAQ